MKGEAAEAHHDARHEQAAWSAKAAIDDHKQQVGGAQYDEGAQREVAVVALAHLKLRAAKRHSVAIPKFLIRTFQCGMLLQTDKILLILRQMTCWGSCQD